MQAYPITTVDFNVVNFYFMSKYSACDIFRLTHIIALKGCRGIVFTHGVRAGGRVGGRREIVCPGCISETVRCRKLILGRDIG